MQATVNLRKKRTVPEMISEIFNYLKIHIYNIFKALLLFVGPFYIIGSIFFGYFYGSMFAVLETNPEAILTKVIFLVPGTILILVGAVAFQAVIVSYMKLSLKLDKTEITLSILYNDAKQYFWNYFGANFLFMIAFIIAIVVVAVILTFMSPVLGVLATICGVIYVSVAFSIYPFAIGIENAPILESFKRSFHLIKNNWWRMLAFFLLASIIQSFMASIAMIPAYIISFYDMFSSAITEGIAPDMSQMGTIMSILMPVLMIINLFFYSFTAVGMGIAYFSLVEEKEEVGLKEQIEAMNPENSPSEE